MRFLLDTNILIPLEDSSHVLEDSLANFVRLAHANSHQLLYHPASEDDYRRDGNAERQKQNLNRIKQFTRLEERPQCPWNLSETKPNDAVDNEILYALHCDAVHALVTEDRGIHDKAKTLGLARRVYTIQTAEDWLRRLHEKTLVQLPNIHDVPLFSLNPYLESEFFESLRADYPTFNDWFREKSREGRHAWIVREQSDIPGAICIYTRQDNETITENGLTLHGPALKLCTFKVGTSLRGRKIGELFLKAAFRYATVNRLGNIFIHGNTEQHHFLFQMLEDFGFSHVGSHPGSRGQELVYLKKHPISPPSEMLEPFEYHLNFFPHFRHDQTISKFIIPIQPAYHRILFPDYNSTADRQLELDLDGSPNNVGNAIKLAYLCHAQTKHMNPGDVVLFYRSGDERAITTLGVVEKYDTMEKAETIASHVKRRTVYSFHEIENMAIKPTRVMLFRLIKHFEHPCTQKWLKARGIMNGSPQSITKISHDAFERILDSEGQSSINFH